MAIGMYAFGQCLRGKCPPFDLRDKELSVVSKVKFRKISLIYKFVFFDLIKFRFYNFCGNCRLFTIFFVFFRFIFHPDPMTTFLWVKMMSVHINLEKKRIYPLQNKPERSINLRMQETTVAWSACRERAASPAHRQRSPASPRQHSSSIPSSLRSRFTKQIHKQSYLIKGACVQSIAQFAIMLLYVVSNAFYPFIFKKQMEHPVQCIYKCKLYTYR